MASDHRTCTGRGLAAAVFVSLLVAAPACGQAIEIDPDASYVATFQELYNTLGRRYCCLEMKGIDWGDVGKELLPKVALVQDDEAFGHLCLQLVARLRDTHARLLPGSRPVPDLPDQPRWHAGWFCHEDDRGLPVVTFVVPDSPAADAGVRPGMTVVSVNDVPALERIAEAQAWAANWVGSSSERNERWKAFRWFPMGREPNAVQWLETVDVEGHAQTFRLVTSLDGARLPTRPVFIPGVKDRANVSWTMLEDGIGYISVTRIREGLEDALDEAVAGLADAKGIVVDVRGNSGGGFDSDRAFLNFDVDRLHVEPERPRFHGPMVFLIDAVCISAGEGWSSWFMARGRATFVGQTTAGASAKKVEIDLRNGHYKVRLPIRPYTGFLSRVIEMRGLEPDVPVMPNAADVAAGRDTALERAKAILLEQAGDGA